MGMTPELKASAQIQTARLTLRQAVVGDAVAVFDRYASDPEVTRFLGWPRHRSVEHTKSFLQFSAQEWEKWPAGPYLIISRANGQLLGGTGLGFQAPNEAAIGFVLARDAWGKGYATEALAAIVDVARRIGVGRLYALCHPENRPSQRVLEKCGFVPDSPARRPAQFPNLSPTMDQDALCYVLGHPGPTT
jgi:RimJ/RimL family protein N-acetyltransferase